MEDETMHTLQAPSPELSAALALGNEARRRAEEQFLETQDPYLLIDATCGDHFLTVQIPGGQIWKYTCAEMLAPGRTVLMLIETANPKNARVFRPSPDGGHPFLGTACRIGVDQGERSVA
jgi:hypothetical protein